LNAIRARLAALDWAHTPTFDINGLKREEPIAATSVMPLESMLLSPLPYL
jgi:Fe-Mn family superoxide dismutase